MKLKINDLKLNSLIFYKVTVKKVTGWGKISGQTYH